MSSVTRLIQSIIRLGVFLGVVGGLGEAFAGAYQKAAGARAGGLFSLSLLNRNLSE